MVERQPSKLNVAGSNPVSRSPAPTQLAANANRPPSSVVEHLLGKEEVMGSIPMVGSQKERIVLIEETQSWRKKNSYGTSPT